MRQKGIFLVHQTAVGGGLDDRFAKGAGLAAARREVRGQSGDDPEHGGFAATRGADDGHQLAFVGEVFYYEGDVMDGDLGLGPLAECFGDFFEGDEFGERALGSGVSHGDLTFRRCGSGGGGVRLGVLGDFVHGMDGVLRSGDPTENRNQERDLTTDGYRSTRILTGENRGNREKGERRAESGSKTRNCRKRTQRSQRKAKSWGQNHGRETVWCVWTKKPRGQ